MMRKYVDKILANLLLLILSTMLLVVIWQVVSRYVLNAPSTFTDEIANYCLIWLGLLGAAYAHGKNLHLSIDLLPRKYTTGAPKLFSSIVTLSVAFFAFTVLVVGGSRLCWITATLGQQSASLQIPLFAVYLALPLSGLLILFYCMDDFLSVKKKTPH